MLLKTLAKQEVRHFEPLAGEKSVHFGCRLRRLLILAPDSRLLTSFYFSGLWTLGFKKSQLNPKK